ncbi:leucine-rich repeat-containing protein 56 isoform X2 [Pseudophryne corroboree]|uniref:leucine-rich repeat-containing protein 56 isoform X2 n=1 Tax=Pseudophryne corroboree TaxID=495146 RepID=UPI0030816167
MNQTLEIRPDTPSVRVIDFGWQGPLNPSPLNRDEDKILVDEYLSPARLKALTGVDDLQEVKVLQMCVDTREHTLGNFGTYMPNLRQLKLNNSMILSIRDLGTSLSHLQVLWMARCGLTDLDGIASFFSLKELYLAYNDLRDLSQVSMLENLEILDLEGNNIDHISELQYLALCSNLTSLTIEGNPICVQPSPEDSEYPDYDYRAIARRMIPQLRYLDDIATDQKNPATPRTPTQDWLMVRDSIKETAGSQVDTALDLGNGLRTPMRSSTAQLGLTRRPQSAPMSSGARKPITSLRSATGSPLSESSEDALTENDASDLTHGVGKVICGNPIKALRARKEKLGLCSGTNLQPQGYMPEHTSDSVMASHKDRADVFAELKTWREKHHEVLQRIQNDRAPQILTITHSDEEEGYSLSSTSENEDLENSGDSWCSVCVSPQSSSHGAHSLAAGLLYLGDMTLQDAPQQPSPPITPCPPASTSASSRPNKGADIRARRLLRVVDQSKTTVLRTGTTNGCLGDEAFLPTDTHDHINRTSKIIQSNDTESRELSGRLAIVLAKPGPSNSRSTVDKFTPKIIPFHQPVIRSKRPSPPPIIRPITTKDVLTRLPNRLTLTTSSRTPST